jgi:MurNAc alpha-1-phosphate uridylyltransferase
MHALILAAGRGERLRPLTDFTPKPLLQAGKFRLIEYHLQALAAAGIVDIVINHAHLGQQIVSALGNGSDYGVLIAYSAEPDGALETAGGIANALPLIKTDPFAVVNGDIWTNYPFDRLPAEISGLAHLVLVDNPAHNPQGDFILHGDRVAESGTGVAANALTFSGIGIYRQALFKGLNSGRIKLAPVLRKAMANKQVSGEHFRGRWLDVGTPQRLAELDNELSNK